MKAMNEHIAAMLEKLHDKPDKKIKNSYIPCQSKSQRFNPNTARKFKNEELNITSEHPSSEYNLERKFQDNISPSNQRF